MLRLAIFVLLLARDPEKQVEAPVVGPSQALSTVPVVAAVYYDDMYVHREFSEETAREVPHIKLWVTNEYEHNGLRADGAAVLGRLLAMVRGEM